MIEIKNASKYYENGNIGVEEINIKLPSKGMIGIFGKSGAGKSSFINCLGGLDQFTKGEIFLDGVGIKDLKQYSTYIFQEYKLIEDFSVLDNLMISNPQADQIKIDAFLKRFLLFEFKNNKVNELSGGQRQRVEIIRALLQDVDIILCDEPISNLDEELSEDILSLFKEISREKLVLIVSHNQDLLKKFTDKFIEIEHHKIIKNTLQIVEDKQSFAKIEETNLSIKNVFRLIWLNIRKAKIKTLMTLLFLFISFSLLLVMISMLTLDRAKLAYNAFKDKNLSYFCANSTTKEEPYFTEIWMKISEEDIKNVDAKIISYHNLFFTGIIDDKHEVKCNMLWELLDSKFRNYVLKDNEILLTTHILNSCALKKEEVIEATFTCGPNQFIIKDVVDLEAFTGYSEDGYTYYPGILANSNTIAALNPNYLSPYMKELNLYFEEKEVRSSIYNPYQDSSVPQVMYGSLPKEKEVCLTKSFIEANQLDEASILGKVIEFDLYNTNSFLKEENRKETRRYKVSGVTESKLIFASSDYNDLKDTCGKNNIKNTNSISIIIENFTLKDIQACFKNGLCPNMLIFNQVNHFYENVYRKYLIVFEALFILTILLGFFTILNSIHSSLIKNKKNIGVFISFKIKKYTILSIYFIENICIGVLALILCLSVYQPILNVLNITFDKQYELSVHYLMPDYGNILYVLLSLFVIIGGSMLYPWIKMIKTMPVDLLYDRK